jgi:predicted esterase
MYSGMRRLSIGICALASLAAQELPRGRVLDRVVCAGNQHQSYALYIPLSYSPGRVTPILYCLDPGARGRIPVERFAKAAAAAGWIVAGSNNSRNGNLDIAREAINWLLRDTQQRFAIDPSRIYVAGFSGGARLALSWASNGGIAGVIACGAAFGDAIPKSISFRVYGTAGVDDFNFDEVYAMSRELSRRGVPQRFAEFAGGHDWLPEELAGPAVEFLAGRLQPETPPPLSSTAKKASDRYNLLTAAIQRGDRPAREGIVKETRRDAQLPDDSAKRRAARRVLVGTYIGATEQGRAELAANNYSAAVEAWDLAVLVRPDSAEACYGLAAAAAANRDTRRALEALRQPVANGFRDRDRIAHDPLFDRLRNDPRFAAAISPIAGPPEK